MYRFLFFCFVFLCISINNVYATTETVKIYSDPLAGGTTSDGRTFEDRYTSWEQTVNNLSSRAAGVDDNHILDISNVLGDGFGPGYFANNRLHFSFDTSVIPEDANIVSSALYLHGSDPDQSSGSEKSVYAVESMRTSASTLLPSDYSKVGNVSFGLTDDNWNTTGYNVINFNQSGINHISKTSITSFALRGWYDFNHVAPNNSNELYIHMMMSEMPGTDKDPYLEVTYEVPEVVENKDMYDLLHELIETVNGYSFSGEIENSYFANLKKVEGFFNNVMYTPAENQIRAFIKKIEQDFKSGKITEVQFDALYESANALLDAIPNDAFGTVPLITQVVSPYPSLEETTSWASAMYAGGRADKVGDCGRTIAQCGCAITSLSMIGKYHGITTGFDGTSVNPLNMNAWLIDNNGYSSDGSVLWNYALAYLGEEKNGKVMSKLSLDGHNETNTNTIRTFIDNANPSLGFNATKGHYVVLTDVMPNAGYSINDPLWYNTKTTDDARDVAGKVQDYNNVVSKANLIGYNSALTPLPESVEIVLESPAELLVVDEKGRRLGYDVETNTFVSEIPGGSYDREDFILNQENPASTPHKAKRIYIAKPEGEKFAVQVIGTGVGEYHLSFAVTDGKGGLFGEQIASTTSVGKVDGYTVTTLSDTDALPSYMQDILKLIPQSEQKKFIQKFFVIAEQIEKNHVVSTEQIVDGLIRFIEEKYSGSMWTVGVIQALLELVD